MIWKTAIRKIIAFSEGIEVQMDFPVVLNFYNIWFFSFNVLNFNDCSNLVNILGSRLNEIRYRLSVWLSDWLHVWIMYSDKIDISIPPNYKSFINCCQRYTSLQADDGCSTLQYNVNWGKRSKYIYRSL